MAWSRKSTKLFCYDLHCQFYILPRIHLNCFLPRVCFLILPRARNVFCQDLHDKNTCPHVLAIGHLTSTLWIFGGGHSARDIECGTALFAKCHKSLPAPQLDWPAVLRVHLVWWNWDSYIGTISKFLAIKWDTWYQNSEPSGTQIIFPIQPLLIPVHLCEFY